MLYNMYIVQSNRSSQRPSGYHFKLPTEIPKMQVTHYAQPLCLWYRSLLIYYALCDLLKNQTKATLQQKLYTGNL